MFGDSRKSAPIVNKNTLPRPYSSIIFSALSFQLMALTSVTANNPGVYVAPPVLVVGLGQTGTVSCVVAVGVMDVKWLINGTSLNSLQLPGVGLGFGSALQFNSVLLEYNNTRIKCIANTTTHGVQTSKSAILLAQGLLAPVGSLAVVSIVESDVNFRWTAPFTLNITFVNPDVTYCVDVVTSTSSATLHSECNITVIEFTFPLPAGIRCDVSTLTVTPANILGNGTSRSIEFSGAMSRARLEQVATIQGTFEYTLIMSALVCNSQVTLMNIDTGDTTTLNDINLTVTETNITFTTQQLKQNHHYTVSVIASNFAGSATSEAMLSTHDITNCSAFQEFGNINISAIFTESSKATGALFHFIFTDVNDGSVDFSKSFSVALNKSDVSRGLLLPLDLFHRALHIVYVYDIEIEKRLLDGLGYPACNLQAIINGVKNSSEPPISESCNVTSLAGMITVVCLFPRFQMTAQINDADRVRVLHINTTMETQTPVTVQVTENGEYLVNVFPIQDGVGILSGVEFSQIHMVYDAPTTQAPSTRHTSTSGTMLSPISTTSAAMTAGTSPFIKVIVVSGLLASLALMLQLM